MSDKNASKEDLREQVARLLYDHEDYGMTFEEAEVYPGTVMKVVVAKLRDRADALLPLFASRERAAAEKGLADVALAEKLIPGIRYRSFEELAETEERWAVRAQLEGEEA